ncbi:MAG: hypothetical protein L0H96_15790 [Humibacillus sp.]|nr:hypothetical protein [Humibacillus sp.]MDN5778362.1 hypothetical protein [Humibacillus sp.]
MQLPDEIRRLAETQFGLVTRAQLNGAGVPPGLTRWHSGDRWRSLLPGVLMLNTGLPSQDQRLMSALLYAGSDSWLAGASALACHSSSMRLASGPVQVYVPYPHRSRRVGWVTIRSTRLTHERLVERGPLRLSCRPRAVVDAAADAIDDRSARAIIVGAVQERVVRLADVEHWVGVRRRNGTVRLKSALREAAAGAWSLPEADLARLLRGSQMFAGLMANPALEDASRRRLTTPDLWLDDVALALMVHSREFHGGVLDWDATVNADSDLKDAGVEVVAFTPHDIEHRPDAVLARAEAGCRRARARSRPAVVSTPRATIALAS